MRDQIKVGEESLIGRDSTLHAVGEGVPVCLGCPRAKN